MFPAPLHKKITFAAKKHTNKQSGTWFNLCGKLLILLLAFNCIFLLFLFHCDTKPTKCLAGNNMSDIPEIEKNGFSVLILDFYNLFLVYNCGHMNVIF